MFSVRCRPYARVVLASASRNTRYTPRPNFAGFASQATGPDVTKVEKIILDQIKASGPISYATYMQLCLSHPTEGYYMNPSNPVFGSRGDFVTSPEISQVFGELLAVWFASQWMASGQQKRIRLLELGPGRGTLMEDILRVLTHFPACRTSLKEVHLIETSLSMRALQKAKLSPFAEQNGLEIFWHESIDDLPPDSGTYTALVAHEFFDALPIHLLEKAHQGWQEVLISSQPDLTAPTILTSPKTSEPGSPLVIEKPKPRLRPALSPSPSPASTLLGHSSPRFQTLPVGSRIEVSPASYKIARKIGEVIGGAAENGSALIIDYGSDKAVGDSFRAFKDHKIVDVFHRPGECDLTANVDFSYLEEATVGLVTAHGPLPQSTFLDRMGLQVRVEMLKRNAKTDERRDIIEKAAKRLVDRTGMGREYKVLGLTGASGDGAPPGEIWPFVDIQEGDGSGSSSISRS